MNVLRVGCCLGAVALSLGHFGGVDARENLPPSAVIRAMPPNGPAPLSVTFDGTVSFDPDGRIVAYEWSFPDGRRLSGPVSAYRFSRAGNFEVALNVTDNDGARSRSTLIVRVGVDGDCVASLEAPTLVAPANNGLAWDGRSFWNTGKVGATNRNLYNIEPTGQAVPPGFAVGRRLSSGTYIYFSIADLTWDGRQLVGITGRSLLFVDRQGRLLAEAQIPDPPIEHDHETPQHLSIHLRGIAWDGEWFWAVNQNLEESRDLKELLKLNRAGVIQHTVALDLPGLEDLAWDGRALWGLDPQQGVVYQLDRYSGAVVRQCELPLDRPTGMTWDGQYFWVLTSTRAIYKLRLEAGGGEFLIRDLVATSGGRVGVPVTFEATVDNTDVEAAQQTVSWLVKDFQGTTIGSQSQALGVAGFATGSAGFTFTFPEPGVYQVELLTEDDHETLIVNIAAAIAPTGDGPRPAGAPPALQWRSTAFIQELNVDGPNVVALEVQVFDLAGRRVLQRRGQGNRLRIDLQRVEGHSLANGVYLYVVTVYNQNGPSHRPQVGKWVLLR